jgi:tetratricopeptide (TPR) repeat protein
VKPPPDERDLPPPPEELSSADRLTTAKQLFDKSRYTEARAHYRVLMNGNSAEREDARFFYAVSFYRQEKWARAAHEFKHLIAHFPHGRWVAAAHWHLALCDLRRGRSRRARARFAYIVRRFPNDAVTAANAQSSSIGSAGGTRAGSSRCGAASSIRRREITAVGERRLHVGAGDDDPERLAAVTAALARLRPAALRRGRAAHGRDGGQLARGRVLRREQHHAEDDRDHRSAPGVEAPGHRVFLEAFRGFEQLRIVEGSIAEPGRLIRTRRIGVLGDAVLRVRHLVRRRERDVAQHVWAVDAALAQDETVVPEVEPVRPGSSHCAAWAHAIFTSPSEP